jgi:hypothetical protein
MTTIASFTTTARALWEPPAGAQWSSVAPLATAPPWLKALAELARLPDNWDGYGSPPLQPRALSTAIRLLSAIDADELPTPELCPVTGGGIGITWQLPPRRLEIEVLPDGSLEYLAVAAEPGAGVETIREGHLTSDRRRTVRRLLYWLVQG